LDWQANHQQLKPSVGRLTGWGAHCSSFLRRENKRRISNSSTRAGRCRVFLFA
jgi:hypothetical protein